MITRFASMVHDLQCPAPLCDGSGCYGRPSEWAYKSRKMRRGLHRRVGRAEIGDNYWQAACAFFEASSVYNVVSPDAITDAKLEAVYRDDYIQVFVDGNNVFDTYPNLFQCDAHPSKGVLCFNRSRMSLACSNPRASIV